MRRKKSSHRGHASPAAVKSLERGLLCGDDGHSVENRLADLWCIADAVQPSALVDLRAFSAGYREMPPVWLRTEGRSGGRKNR